jgi:hypothetical protein
MSNVDQLLLILLAVYLSECVLYLREGATAIGKWFERWVVLDGALQIGKSGGGLTVLSPLPWQTACVCEPWPVAVSAEGITGLAGKMEGQEHAVPEARLWADITSIKTDGRWLRINDLKFAECASTTLSRQLAKLLLRFKDLDADRRSQPIAKALEASLDVKTASERWQNALGAMATLKFRATLLFFAVFVAIPIVDRTYPVWLWAPWMAIVVFVLSMANVWRLRRVLRSIEGLDATYRFKSLLQVTLSPVASMRAPQFAAAHFLANFHPLTVAAATTPNEFVRLLAGKVWRELCFPLPNAPADGDDLAVRVRTAYENMLKSAVEGLLNKLDLTPEELTAAPVPDGPDSIAYCPRCHNQYRDAKDTCHACIGLPLLAMPASNESAVAR